MDYEHKYKEALERAKEIIRYYKEHNRSDEASIEDLEVIFPELKESENGEIRKTIIGKASAWLEKQKPADNVDPDDIQKEILIYLDWLDGRRCVAPRGKYTIKDMVSWIKQKPSQRMISGEAKEVLFDYENANIQQKDFAEQKPVEWSEEDEQEFNFIIKFLSEKHLWSSIGWLRALKDMCLLQQQEFSEDDEPYLDHIINAVKNYYTDYEGKENPFREPLLDWLESLKDRLLPQPKQEWSEEDELRYKAFTNLVELYYGSCLCKTEKTQMLSWLKAIKERLA